MSDAARELELVRKALTSGLSNCVEWVNDKAKLDVRRNIGGMKGLTPDGIRELLIVHAESGGAIEQRSEDRDLWKERRDFWYFAVVPIQGLLRGIFVEMALLDDDPDVPIVLLLNAHKQLE